MIFRKKIQSSIQKIGYSINRYTPPDYRWITNRGIKTVIDVGANEGQFANTINTIIPGVRIHSFEPVKKCYRSLVESNKHLNIATYNFALGDKNYKSIINVSSHSPSSSLLKMADLHKEIFEFSQEHTTEEIEIKTLDSIEPELKIDYNLLIKMDVQGFEDKVIEGGKNTIPKAEILLIETSFKELYEKQVLFDNIYNHVKELGFYFAGNYQQTPDPKDGSILYADSVFIKNRNLGNNKNS